jgi:hypothetical protein
MAMQLRVTSDAELREIVDRAGKRERRWLPVRHGATSGWVAERLIEKIGGSPPNGQQPTTEDEIVAIIREAARAFAQPEEDLLRVGRCESNLDPRAVNPNGPYFGLFQFLRSTWASTPFADRDIFDPVANAHAAAWMWQQGRRGEWACQ